MFMSLWRTLIPYYAMHVKMKGQGHVHIWGLHEPESATYHGVWTNCIISDKPGFVRLRENLENLEKGTFLKRIRENLENSGNFPTIFTTSGKTQGILFCQISLIKYVVLSE